MLDPNLYVKKSFKPMRAWKLEKGGVIQMKD